MILNAHSILNNELPINTLFLAIEFLFPIVWGDRDVENAAEVLTMEFTLLSRSLVEKRILPSWEDGNESFIIGSL